LGERGAEIKSRNFSGQTDSIRRRSVREALNRSSDLPQSKGVYKKEKITLTKKQKIRVTKKKYSGSRLLEDGESLPRVITKPVSKLLHGQVQKGPQRKLERE